MRRARLTEESHRPFVGPVEEVPRVAHVVQLEPELGRGGGGPARSSSCAPIRRRCRRRRGTPWTSSSASTTWPKRDAAPRPPRAGPAGGRPTGRRRATGPSSSNQGRVGRPARRRRRAGTVLELVGIERQAHPVLELVPVLRGRRRPPRGGCAAIPAVGELRRGVVPVRATADRDAVDGPEGSRRGAASDSVMVMAVVSLRRVARRSAQGLGAESQTTDGGRAGRGTPATGDDGGSAITRDQATPARARGASHRGRPRRRAAGLRDFVMRRVRGVDRVDDVRRAPVRDRDAAVQSWASGGVRGGRAAARPPAPGRATAASRRATRSTAGTHRGTVPDSSCCRSLSDVFRPCERAPARSRVRASAPRRWRRRPRSRPRASESAAICVWASPPPRGASRSTRRWPRGSACCRGC